MSDRHEMQAAGTHPAPCARHCEAKAYEIEIRRLRHDIERHVGIATEVTQELEQLRAEVERLRGITNTPHFKPRSRAELKYLSHDELVSDVIRFELKYLHRSSMFFHLDQSHEKLRAELAASREREARMQWQPIETAPKDGSLFLCWVYAVRYGETDDGQQYHQDVSQVDFCSWREGPSGLRDHGYFDPCCGQIADHQDVTHWMPLPASPRAALVEGAQE